MVNIALRRGDESGDKRRASRYWGGMSQTPRNLTGPWMGRYNYAVGGGAPVAFNANITDVDGALSGETLEANTFTHLTLEADQLIAGIIGVREGRDVHFTKRYSDFDGPRLNYEGKVNGAFTRIEGRWFFPDTPAFHGTFALIRDTVAVEARRDVSRRARGGVSLPLDGRDEG